MAMANNLAKVLQPVLDSGVPEILVRHTMQGLVNTVEGGRHMYRELSEHLSDFGTFENQTFQFQADMDWRKLLHSLKKVTESQVTPLQQARAKKLQRLKAGVVIAVKKFLKERDYQACKCDFHSRDFGNLVILTAPTQNGKTKEMLALSWVAFFEHGMGTYLFVRPDATAYAEITQSVQDFNPTVLEFVRSKMKDGWWAEDGIDPSLYCLKISTLQDKRNLAHDDILYLNHSAGGGETTACKALVRTRLLQATNVYNAQKNSTEISMMVEAFGLTEDEKRIGVMIIVDESQNSRQSVAQDRKLESALFRPTDQTSIKASVQSFLRSHRIETAESQKASSLAESLPSSLRQMAGLYVEVTATPEPTFLLERNATYQVLRPKLHPDYFGYLDELPENRKISIKGFQEMGIDGVGADDKALTMAACYSIYHNAQAKPDFEGFQHVLVYHRLATNADMDDVALWLTRGCDVRPGPPGAAPDGLKTVERPVIVLCAYARYDGFGTGLFGNRRAREVLVSGRNYLLEAEKDIFIDAAGYESLVTEKPEKYDKKKPKNGEFVTVDDGYRIFQRKSMTDGFELGDDFEMSGMAEGDDTFVLKLPSRMLFRVRTALTLITKAFTKAGVGHDDLFLVTLGKRLLREGLTVKTWDHQLAPTIQICPIDHDKFYKIPAVELIQACGRLCGIRKVSDLRESRPPVMITRAANVDVFRAMVQWNHKLISSILKSRERKPNITLGEAMDESSRNPELSHAMEPFQTVRKQVQPEAMSFLPREVPQHQDTREEINACTSWLNTTLNKAQRRLVALAYRHLCAEAAGDFPGYWKSDVRLFAELKEGGQVSHEEEGDFFKLFELLEEASNDEKNGWIEQADVDDTNEALAEYTDGALLVIARDQTEDQPDEESFLKAGTRAKHSDSGVHESNRFGLFAVEDEPDNLFVCCKNFVPGQKCQAKGELTGKCVVCGWQFHACASSDELDASKTCSACQEANAAMVGHSRRRRAASDNNHASRSTKQRV